MTTIPPTNPIKLAKKIGIRLFDDQERIEFISVCRVFELYKSIESLVIPPRISFKPPLANNFRYVDASDPHKQKFTLEYMWEILRGRLGITVNLMYRIYYHIWRCKDATSVNFIHPVVNPWALMNVRIRLVSFYTCLDIARKQKSIPPKHKLYRYWINYYLCSIRGKSIWCPIHQLTQDLYLASYLDKFTTIITSTNTLDALRRKHNIKPYIEQQHIPTDITQAITDCAVNFKINWLTNEELQKLSIPTGSIGDEITDDDRNDPDWPENWITTDELYNLEHDIANWMRELYFDPIPDTNITNNNSNTDNNSNTTNTIYNVKMASEFVDNTLLDTIINEKEQEAIKNSIDASNSSNVNNVSNKGIKSTQGGNIFKLTDQQRQAIVDCIKNKCNVLVGFPGTGKSTIVDIVTQYFYRLASTSKPPIKFHISLCALSGMAAIGLLDKCNEVKRRDTKLCGTIDKLCHTIYPNLGPQFIADNDDDPDSQIYNGDIAVFEDPYELMDNYSAVNDMARLHTGGAGLQVKVGPDIVIVDEFSMVDLFKFHDLLYFVRQFDCRLLLVGDYNQLPSIGPGALLKDMVDSNSSPDRTRGLRFPVNRLTHIKRQSNGSQALVSAIKKMTTGTIGKTDLDTTSFRFLDYDAYGKQSAEIATDIAGLVSSLSLTRDNSKFICPQNTGVMGANELNNALQQVYNPMGQPIFTFGRKSYGKKRKGGGGMFGDMEFRLGDLVVRVENDYSKSDTEVYVNGDRGRLELAAEASHIDFAKDQGLDVSYITKNTSIGGNLFNSNSRNSNSSSTDSNDDNYNVDASGNVVKSNNTNNVRDKASKDSKSGEPKKIYKIVYTDGKTELISNWELYQSFRLAYALTIHKAQGSQFENVVVVMTYDQRYMWTTPECEHYNMLYTAISRGVKRCIMIGRSSILMKARKRIPLERYSSLF